MKTKEEIAAFLAAEFRPARGTIQDVGGGGATVSLDIGTAELRPGGTVSGPALVAVADLVGRSLAVGEVSLYSEGLSEPVAHVVGTYSIPPRSER